jgi:hypothetical protein
MKNIEELNIDELRKERDELWGYLYITDETAMYDDFDYNGLDYWDAKRRHHKIVQRLIASGKY